MKSFIDVYNTISKEKLENLEKLRKKDLNLSKFELLLIIIFILLTMLNFLCGKNVILIEMIIIGATYVISRTYSYSSLKKDYEKDVIKPIVESYSEKIIYDTNGEITKKEYADAGYKSGDEFYCENYFESMDKKIRAGNISVISNTTDEDGHEKSQTLFSGIFSIINLDNYVKESITMKTDSKIRNLFNYSNKRKIEVDSAEFEENFDLFSENRIYAMEVFTSEILSSIIKLTESDDTKYDFVLRENKLYVRYYNNIFDIKLKEKIDMEKVENLYNNVYKLLNLLTTLQKNIDKKLEFLENNLKLKKI